MSEEQCIVEDDSGPDGRGWVKLHRRIRDSAIFANPVLLKVWVWAMTKATHRRKVVSIRTGRGTTQIELQPGQFIYGRNIAADELNLPPSTVNDAMQKLKALGSVHIQPNTHCSIVTANNWATYQGGESSDQQPTRHPSDTQATPIRHIQEQKQHKEVPEKSAQPTSEHFTPWWNVYPRKVAKLAAQKPYAAALARIASEKAVTLDVAAADLLASTVAYAAAVKGHDDKFIPYPASWLNAGQYLDVPKSWSTLSNEQRTRTAGNSPARPRNGEYSDPNKYRTAEAAPRA